jgi:hypothetical protein
VSTEPGQLHLGHGARAGGFGSGLRLGALGVGWGWGLWGRARGWGLLGFGPGFGGVPIPWTVSDWDGTAMEAV